MDRVQVMGPPTLLPLPRPLMTGEVLDAAFRLFRAALASCLPYSALLVLLLYLPALWNIFADESAALPFGTPFRGATSPLAYLVVVVLIVPLLGMILLRLDALARGERPRFRAEGAAALRRWPAGALATFGAFVIPMVLLWIGPAFSDGLSMDVIVFLAVPLFWPAALFVVALPAFWCDRLGAVDAITRSVAISARKSWRMVGALLSTMCVVAVFYALAAVLLAFMLPVFGRADLVLIAAIEQLLYLVIGALGMPFVLAVLLVAYRDLDLRARERRGGAA